MPQLETKTAFLSGCFRIKWENKSTIDTYDLLTSAYDHTTSLRLMRNPIVSLRVANVSDIDEPFQ